MTTIAATQAEARNDTGSIWPRAAHLETFLREAVVTGSEEIGIGVTESDRVTLELEGESHQAILKKYHREHDSWRREVAAYELDKLIGLGMVPPTVERRLKGRTGGLQLWVEGEMMADWTGEPDDLDSWRMQVSAMWLFDYLTANADRHINNALVAAGPRLVLIDNSRAFKTFDGVVAGIDEARGGTRARFWITQYDENRERFDTRYDDNMIDNLRALDKESLKRAIGRYIDGSERRALLERRDRILEQIRAIADLEGDTDD